LYVYYPQAIVIDRLKGNEQDGDADDSEVCEMLAHYKIKYGLEGLEKSISKATIHFSKSLDYNQTLAFSLPNLSSDSNSLTGSREEDDEMSYIVMHRVSPTASEGVVSSLANMRSSSSIRGRGDSQVPGNSSVGSHDPTNITSHNVTTSHSDPVIPSLTVYDDSDNGVSVCVCVVYVCACMCVCVRV